MKNSPALLLIIFLSLCFSQCTIEKRLYNKGFHVERRTWKISQEISDEDAETQIDVEASIVTTHTDSMSKLVERKQTIIDSSFDDVAETVILSDQRSSVQKSARLTQLEKREGLIASGFATAFFGFATAGLVHLAVTSTVAGAFLILGPLAIICGVIAFLFFLLFLIYLFLPTKEKRNNDQFPENRSGIRERKYSEAERVAIVLASIFGFVIALALILPAINA